MRDSNQYRPDYKKLIFVKNENRPDIYDLQNTNFNKFTYIRLSEPKADFLIKQGAKHVIESWKNGKKVLFTGLKPIHGKIFHGNHKEPANGKKSMIFAIVEPEQIVLYYFNHFTIYPSKRRSYAKQFNPK